MKKTLATLLVLSLVSAQVVFAQANNKNDNKGNTAAPAAKPAPAPAVKPAATPAVAPAAKPAATPAVAPAAKPAAAPAAKPAAAPVSNDKGALTIAATVKEIKDNEYAAYTTPKPPKGAFPQYSGALVIPSGVATIGTQAFYGNKFSSVTISANTKVAKSAFASNQLAAVTIGDKATIATQAFFDNAALATVTIGADVVIEHDNAIDAAFKRLYATGGAGTYTKSGKNWTKK
ncbi:leucine-rich repeat protein [Breznakiellaceae bacterium SP9]